MPWSTPPGETYRVLVNRSRQYSIWPTERELPSGWTYAGMTGSKDECLAHIEEVWTAACPPGLRGTMAEAGL